VTLDFGRIVAGNLSLFFSPALRFPRDREGAEELAQDAFLRRGCGEPSFIGVSTTRESADCVRGGVRMEAVPEPVAELSVVLIKGVVNRSDVGKPGGNPEAPAGTDRGRRRRRGRTRGGVFWQSERPAK
jgi:hypothetical protein